MGLRRQAPIKKPCPGLTTGLKKKPASEDHCARGDNQISVAEQHDCINPYAAIKNLECPRKFFTRWWQVLALYNHAGPQAPLYNRDVRKRNKKRKSQVR